jgi:hypothetical protein
MNPHCQDDAVLFGENQLRGDWLFLSSSSHLSTSKGRHRLTQLRLPPNFVGCGNGCVELAMRRTIHMRLH